jgi:hypothetical protein
MDSIAERDSSDQKPNNQSPGVEMELPITDAFRFVSAFISPRWG